MTPAEVSELDDLRAENERLREELRLTERECEILHSLQARSSGGVAVARSVQIGSRERMAMLEHAIEVLDGFVHEMTCDDCCYGCEPDSKCRPCRAQEALEAVRGWRYSGALGPSSTRFEGAMHYRTLNGWNPREARVHAAFVKHMETWGHDRTLGLILTDRQPGQPDGIRDWPTARDWYVATSIVQWLVTNVGSSILVDAGWKYMQWDEDRALLDERRNTTERQSL
jgi:hypothetical protein